MTFAEMLEKYTLKIGQNVTGGEVTHDLRELEMEVPVCATCSYRALAKELIDSTDVVSVVRCKDCRFYMESVGVCYLDGCQFDDSDFCSVGERRTDEPID